MKNKLLDIDINIEDLDLENDSNKIKVIKENGNK